MITILTWISLVAGGLLVLLFLISFIGGLELDIEMGSTHVETDAGGLGLIKGFLTFLSISAWVMKVLLVSNKNPGMALTIAIISGILAFLILNYLLRLLLKNESNVNWSMQDAQFTTGVVYLKIPGNSGNGIVNVTIKGATREIKAKSKNKEEIETGARIIIVDIEGDFAIVEREQINS